MSADEALTVFLPNAELGTLGSKVSAGLAATAGWAVEARATGAVALAALTEGGGRFPMVGMGLLSQKAPQGFQHACPVKSAAWRQAVASMNASAHATGCHIGPVSIFESENPASLSIRCQVATGKI